MSSREPGRWADPLWALGMAGQGGLMIAVPVLIGLGLGYWLDRQLGTVPWISLVLTVAGAITGPVMLYRWVTSSVAVRMASRMENKEEQDEENPE